MKPTPDSILRYAIVVSCFRVFVLIFSIPRQLRVICSGVEQWVILQPLLPRGKIGKSFEPALDQNLSLASPSSRSGATLLARPTPRPRGKSSPDFWKLYAIVIKTPQATLENKSACTLCRCTHRRGRALVSCWIHRSSSGASSRQARIPARRIPVGFSMQYYARVAGE